MEEEEAKFGEKRRESVPSRYKTKSVRGEIVSIHSSKGPSDDLLKWQSKALSGRVTSRTVGGDNSGSSAYGSRTSSLSTSQAGTMSLQRADSIVASLDISERSRKNAERRLRMMDVSVDVMPTHTSLERIAALKKLV
ncbi:hypothetical protein ADUPG1_011349 [Aduncisulcus paluster]|nr:hypothetical protein ADUPG1_011349 [Aduncisulcus paluster]